ncbi:4-demethylwyosine synthase TYW1 [Candidatus Woesearchaeota archaeon]|nr:4-demethylwyosine synthase TYW1 [Candidatus Woesearchaeota archaeon]
MLTQEAKEELIRQQYRVVGEHSAVKICGWTKNMLRGRGGCYKLKFYGIMSHQCLQMSTSLSCANRCMFCWRGYKAPVSKEWKWGVDDPAMILDGSLAAQESLLTGFGGHDEVHTAMHDQSKEVKHVALSLTGEPIIYPRINELLALFDKRGISTFMVTNAQYAEQIKNLAPVTQLYLSLDAPNKKLLKKVDVPLFTDYWERLNKSLEYLAEKQQRTCIRLTAIKGVNMIEPENYAALIRKGSPDFIEIKSYMHVGASRKFLGQENMPLHEEIIAFTKEILEHLPDYELVSEHIPSRVVMVVKKKYKKAGEWFTWIDFPKYKKLSLAGKPFTTDDYLRETPKNSLGISGKKTPTKEESIEQRKQQKARQLKLVKKAKGITVDESTQELDFYNEELDDEGC